MKTVRKMAEYRQGKTREKMKMHIEKGMTKV